MTYDPAFWLVIKHSAKRNNLFLASIYMYIKYMLCKKLQEIIRKFLNKIRTFNCIFRFLLIVLCHASYVSVIHT